MAPNTESRGASSPRGRPYQQAAVLTGLSRPPARIAWLLRANRLFADNDEWRKLSTFAAAFRGGCYPTGVSQSTVSRWETAGARLTYEAVRRYEELLDLRPGRLVAMADTLHRYAAPGVIGPPALSRNGSSHPMDHDRLEELVDRAVSTDAMTGWEWDELTAQLSALPTVVLSPRKRWSDLVCRLVAETIVADGTAWMLRYEALNRILAHPRGAEAAIAACAELVADPTNQVFIEPMSVLDASAHPDAARRVIEQLILPTNERSQYGALLACVRKLRYGHFTEDQVAGLVPAVLEMVLDPSAYPDAGALAVALLRRLPTPQGTAADSELRRVLAADRTLSQVHQVGRLAAADTSAVVVQRILTATVSNGHLPGFHDDVLPHLIDEILFAPVLDVRLYAAMIVGATPYKPMLAAALAGELTSRPVVSDSTLASSVLGALRVLGGPAERILVERLVLAPGLAPDVTLAAVRAIGHIGGVSPDRFWLNTIALYGRRWRRHRDQYSAFALNGLVYAMGIARNQRLLTGVRDDDEAPWPVRSAASWWLNRPTQIMSSAIL